MNTQLTKPIEQVSNLKTKNANKAEEAGKFQTMRIYDSTAATLEKLSDQINAGGPKRVQWKDIVEVAVTKVNPSDLKKLREEKLTATDRFEDMFKTFKSKHPDSSRESFLSELMKNVDPKTFQ